MDHGSWVRGPCSCGSGLQSTDSVVATHKQLPPQLPGPWSVMERPGCQQNTTVTVREAPGPEHPPVLPEWEAAAGAIRPQPPLSLTPLVISGWLVALKNTSTDDSQVHVSSRSCAPQARPPAPGLSGGPWASALPPTPTRGLFTSSPMHSLHNFGDTLLGFSPPPNSAICSARRCARSQPPLVPPGSLPRRRPVTSHLDCYDWLLGLCQRKMGETETDRSIPLL